MQPRALAPIMTPRVASVLALVNVAILLSPATDQRPQTGVEDPGVSGYVLAPRATRFGKR